MKTRQWRHLRRSAEAAIERLLLLIDDIDGDADTEESGDLEPSLGAPERHPHCAEREAWRARPYRDRDGAQAAWSAGGRDDSENEHDDREPDVDDELSGDEEEPSLGAFDRLIDQDHGWRQTQGSDWFCHTNADLEVEPSTS
jgi:hypothetical protein